MAIMQFFVACETVAPITVRAIISLPETSHLPYQHLPPLNEDIAFTGEIASLEQGCVVVLVDAHTPFPLTDWIEDASDEEEW